MGRKRTFVPLDVYFNSQLVGKLEREWGGVLRFSYDRDWLDSDHRIPISLSLPLATKQYSGLPVFTYFENLLPDDSSIRRKIARDVDAKGSDAFSLLAKIGRDCIGGLQFLREGQKPGPTQKLAGIKVSDEQIASMLLNLNQNPLGMKSDVQDFRISVAGVQEKTALLYKEGNWFKPEGTTPTTHIIKPEIEFLSASREISKSVENEFFCLKLLANFGLKTAKAKMTKFGNVKALVVERFDRKWTENGHLHRLHQEDFCQVLAVGSDKKYQSDGGPGIKEILEILLGSDDSIKDRYDFFKTNILFWLIGATDGHAKNFSILHLPGGRYMLAPLYDVLTAQPYFDAFKLTHREFRLAMSQGRRNNYKILNISGRHFFQTGEKSNFQAEKINNIFEEIFEIEPAAMEKTINLLPSNFPMEIAESVNKGVKERIGILAKEF